MSNELSLLATAAAIEKAKVPEDVFGLFPTTGVDPLLKELTAKYRQVVQAVHPDKFYGSPHVDKANETFRRLTEWRDQAETKIRAGTYGDRKPVVTPTDPPAFVDPQIVKTPKRTYTVTDLIAHGSTSDVYKCTYKEGKKEHTAAFKLVQSPADNDLLENESKILAGMYPKGQKEEKFYRYLTKPIDAFMLRGISGTNRRVHVMQYADGYVPLADVIAEYPKGIDFRDTIWVWKRFLAAIGFVHSQKHVVHGAILPTNVLIHPTGHGAKIVDWCYAVSDWEKLAGKVRGMVSFYKSFYAPEIEKKLPPTPQTDLYMGAKCMVALMGGDISTNQLPATVPRQIQAFFGSCLLTSQNRRPDSAWQLHEEFDELLVRVGIEKKYRPLKMPTKGK